MSTKATVLVKIRDSLEEQLQLIKAVTDDRGMLYVLRLQKSPLGMKFGTTEEIVILPHEAADLLSALLDEVEEWRKLC